MHSSISSTSLLSNDLHPLQSLNLYELLIQDIDYQISNTCLEHSHPKGQKIHFSSLLDKSKISSKPSHIRLFNLPQTFIHCYIVI